MELVAIGTTVYRASDACDRLAHIQYRAIVQPLLGMAWQFCLFSDFTICSVLYFMG